MPAETVTLDRQMIVDLLIEAYAVCDILEDLAGVTPFALTEALTERLEEVAVAALGPHGVGPKGETVGPAADIWGVHADKRARQLASEIIRGGRDDAS